MVSIIEVTTKGQLRQFVDYPNILYKDVPQFVPATFDDDMSDWDKKKNPAFEYCEARCWMAMRNGEMVGRIGAILSHKANEKWGTNRMRFTQVDFIDDEQVANALFATVERWAREKGCNEVHGPLGFTDLDREGMLVEGFDRRSCFFTYYNHPYYIDHLTRLDYFGLIPRFFQLVNTCYAPLYGTVELSDKQIKRYSAKFAPLINPNLAFFIMDEHEDMVAMGVAAPSIASALQKSRGKYFPTGWIDLLKAFHKNDTIDLLLIAVRPDYQKKGVNAMILYNAMQGCHKLGIKEAETGPMLETNEKVQSQWKDFDIEQHKRRRCFIKKLK